MDILEIFENLGEALVVEISLGAVFQTIDLLLLLGIELDNLIKIYLNPLQISKMLFDILLLFPIVGVFVWLRPIFHLVKSFLHQGNFFWELVEDVFELLEFIIKVLGEDSNGIIKLSPFVTIAEEILELSDFLIQEFIGSSQLVVN